VTRGLSTARRAVWTLQLDRERGWSRHRIRDLPDTCRDKTQQCRKDMTDHTKTPHVVQNSSALADVVLPLSDRVQLATRRSPCFGLNLRSVQLLSITLLTCPPTVHLPYYKQSIPAGLAGSCAALLDRARTCFGRRSSRSHVCTSCAAEALW